MLLDCPLYPIQHDFVISPVRHPAMLGGIGTGKSRGGCLKALYKAVSNPGCLGCVTAPTYPMLRDATKRTFFEICPPELVAFRNDSENLVGIHTPNGKISEIFFRSTSDPESLRGPNLLWFMMDEAAMSTLMAFQILAGRIRCQPADEQQGWICTTPKGLNWVYDLWGPAAKLEEGFRTFHATTRDNIFLPEEYIHSIYAMYKGTFAAQELEGKFTAYEGLIYGDLYDDNIHVGTFPFKQDLPVELTWDFGYPNPEVALVIQQDYRGHVFIIDELYRMRTLTEDIVAEARARPWFANVIDVVCDDARPDLIKRLTDLFLPARPAHKGRVLDGIKTVRHLLAPDTITGGPMLHIDRRCEMLLKEFKLYRWEDKDPQTDQFPERPVKAWDHALDALRYWTTSKWLRPGAVSSPAHVIKPRRRILAYQLMK